MISKYEGLSDLDPNKLVSMVKNDAEFKKYMTRKKIFKKDERRVLPLVFRVNLETLDEEYILKTTGRFGPYSGIIRYD